jgi:hypothetical protein
MRSLPPPDGGNPSRMNKFYDLHYQSLTLIAFR